MARERILVTGGAGFIGSSLCERLLDEGHEVIAFDDLTTGKEENLSHLAFRSSFTFVEGDVTSPFDFDVTQVYNLASPASPVHYQADPVRTTMTNVLGTFHALSLARRRSARFLQASTSEVYGDPAEHPQTESYHGNVNPVGIRACYDEGKRCAESLVMDFARRHGVRAKIARIFNTYGPRMALDDGRVVTSFIVQALSGAELTVFGNGKQTRSFCYVDDLVSGLVALMNHPGELGPVNLGNPEETTVLDLAHRVIAIVGGEKRIVFRPLPEDDPQRRKPDISLARRALGFAPKVSLDIGLQRTIESFRMAMAAHRRERALGEVASLSGGTRV